MGWTETNWVKGTKIINWFRENYNHENDKIKQTILDAALVDRTEAFAALEIINKETGAIEVKAIVVKMKFRKGNYNHAYKDMDETMGPYICKCPKRIMKFLTPTNNENALAWRKRVEDYWTQKDTSNKKLGKLNVGDTIVFNKPIEFTNGTSFKSLRVHRTKPLRLTDGSQSIFGYVTEYKMTRKALETLVDHVIPSDQGGSVERIIEKVNEKNIDKYPKYKFRDKEYTCILWAQGKNGWEWYGFETDKEDENIYFGYVMGYENEFGYFSIQELLDVGVNIMTNPKDLMELMPPEKWEKIV